MYKLTDSEIRFLLNQDRLTKLEGIALLTGGYQEKFSTLDHISNGPSLSLKVLAFKDVLDLKTPPPNKPENLLIFNKIFEIDETISRSLGFTLFPVEDILDVYVIGAEDPTFETESFLEWAHQKGFIPPSLSQDLKPFLNTLTAAISTKPEKPGRERTSADSEALNMLPNQNALRNDSDTTISKKIEIDPPEIISSVLTKSWEPERPINRLSQNRELGIWNNWIQPIMNLHYNGVFGYKYFKEPENLNYDDLGALWEQYIAPVICSNIPPWLKYPQSMDQGELESLIGENIWEPEDFVSEIILPLKAGREPGLVDPFFRCLTSIIRRGELPVLLAYIAQDRRRGATALNVLSGVCTPGGDFPKDRMTQQGELAVWDRWIRPIIDKHFNGRIEYQFFNEPDVIAPDHIDVVLRKMLEPFVFQYEHGPFPTDDFLKEIMERLWMGFDEYEGVNLKKWFQNFLSWVMYESHLPVFLAYIEHESDKFPIPEIKMSSAPNDTSQNLVESDSQRRGFYNKGGKWRIMFEGQTYYIDNKKPLEYMLPLIKQPKKSFRRIELCQIVEGVYRPQKKEKNKKEVEDVKDEATAYEDDLHFQGRLSKQYKNDNENDSDYEDGLYLQGSIKKHSEKDIQMVKENIHKFYQEYLNDQDGKREDWNNVKRFTETEYGILIKDSAGTLKFHNSKYSTETDTDYEKASKTVSTNKKRFLEQIKKQGCDSLYQHFEQCIKSEKGFIQYRPPDGSPLWEIIE